MNKIDILRNHVESNLSIKNKDYLVFETSHYQTGEMLVGIICRDLESEELDNHCDQCRDEISPFNFKGPSEELSNYLIVTVGSTKFNRIQSGWRDSQGMDLKKVKFV